MGPEAAQAGGLQSHVGTGSSLCKIGLRVWPTAGREPGAGNTVSPLGRCREGMDMDPISLAPQTDSWISAPLSAIQRLSADVQNPVGKKRIVAKGDKEHPVRAVLPCVTVGTVIIISTKSQSIGEKFKVRARLYARDIDLFSQVAVFACVSSLIFLYI